MATRGEQGAVPAAALSDADLAEIERLLDGDAAPRGDLEEALGTVIAEVRRLNADLRTALKAGAICARAVRAWHDSDGERGHAHGCVFQRGINDCSCGYDDFVVAVDAAEPIALRLTDEHPNEGTAAGEAVGADPRPAAVPADLIAAGDRLAELAAIDVAAKPSRWLDNSGVCQCEMCKAIRGWWDVARLAFEADRG